MPRNPLIGLTTEAFHYLRLFLSSSAVIAIILIMASCGHDKKVAIRSDEISLDSLRIILSDSNNVNWLTHHGWDSIEINAKDGDKEQIQHEMDKVRYYVQGALTLYNNLFVMQDRKIPYKIVAFRYAVVSRNPLRFTMLGILNPQAQKLITDDHHDPDDPMGHLKPPEPPPPPK